MYNNRFYAMQQNVENDNIPVGYVRILHAVPNAPNVDIYVDDTLFVNDLAYGEYNDYLPLPEGKYKITLYVAGTINAPLISKGLAVNADTYLTIAIIGTLDSIGIAGSVDADTAMIQDKAMMRFAHLSPDAPAVDITLPDDTVIFGDVSFKEMTPYIDVLPMEYTLQVRVAGTSMVVLAVPDIEPVAGKYYTIYAIGLVGDEPELEALLLMDGNRMYS